MHINYYDVYGKVVRLECDDSHIPRKTEIIKLPPDNGAWEVMEVEYVYQYKSGRYDTTFLKFINISLKEDTKGF